MAKFDVVIRGGTFVDGSGRLNQAFKADLAIKDVVDQVQEATLSGSTGLQEGRRRLQPPWAVPLTWHPSWMTCSQ